MQVWYVKYIWLIRALSGLQDEKPTWGDDIDTAYAEDEEDEEGGGEMDYAGEGEEYPEFDEAYAPGGDAEEDVDMETEEPPLNMVSYGRLPCLTA
jgi:hypothetical protein